MPSKSREAAFLALRGFYKHKTFSDVAVEEINRQKLEPRDRALAVNIVTGVIQNQSCLDYYLARYSGRSVSSLDLNLRVILETAAYQLVFLSRIPHSAAVNEAVGLAKIYAARASGLVNAVLRRLSEDCLKQSLPEIEANSRAEYLSIKYSCGADLTDYLMDHHGEAFTEAFLQSVNCVPPLTLRVNTLKTTAEAYAELLEKRQIAFERCSLVPDSFRVSQLPVTELPGYEEGLFYIQDEAAGFAAELAEVGPGAKLLDCCAAPGGKSFAAAIRLQGACEILSCDISEKKTALIDAGYARLGIPNCRTEVRDASVFAAEYEGRFDAVLCDVPCSGFGVLRKKPEIKYKAFSDVDRLPEIQSAILRNVSHYVAPGGILVYSTCTVLREENEAVVLDFLRGNPDFEPMDFQKNGIGSTEGMVTFWPQLHGTDGFFAARMKRKQL